MWAMLLRPGARLNKNDRFDIKDVATEFDITEIKHGYNQITFEDAREDTVVGGLVIWDESGIRYMNTISLPPTNVPKGSNINMNFNNI